MTLTLRGLFLALIPASSIFAVIFGPLSLINKNIRLNTSHLLLAIVTIAANVFSFLITENFALVRLSLMIALAYIVWEQLRAFRHPLILVSVAEIVFFIHIFIILMSMATGFSFMGFQENNIDGRFSSVFGYDYVSYFILSFLTVAWSRRLYKTLGYLCLAIISCFLILYSGRFGLVLISLYLIFLMTSLRFNQILLFFAVGAIFIPYFAFEKLTYMIETIQALASYGTLGDAAFIGLEFSGDSSYAASPLILVAEYKTLISKIMLLPSDEYRVFDAGPPYILLNCGIVLGLLNYYFMFKCFSMNSLVKIVLVLYLVILDFKFRSALSTFPMIWTMLMIKLASDVNYASKVVR